MTREEAIHCLNVYSSTNGSGLCTDEQHYEAKQIAIKALEQEPCDDCISRKAALDCVDERINELRADKEFSITKGNCIVGVKKYILSLPSVTSQEPKTGHWISYYDEDAKVGWYECDRCHTEKAFNTNYCPDCGARMAEPQKSENKK